MKSFISPSAAQLRNGKVPISINADENCLQSHAFPNKRFATALLWDRQLTLGHRSKLNEGRLPGAATTCDSGILGSYHESAHPSGTGRKLGRWRESLLAHGFLRNWCAEFRVHGSR